MVNGINNTSFHAVAKKFPLAPLSLTLADCRVGGIALVMMCCVPMALAAETDQTLDTQPLVKQLKVNRGDTLMTLASTVLPSGLSIQQATVALYQANPSAFYGSIHRMKHGVVLDVPSAKQMAALSKLEAMAVLRSTPSEKLMRPSVEPTRQAAVSVPVVKTLMVEAGSLNDAESLFDHDGFDWDVFFELGRISDNDDNLSLESLDSAALGAALPALAAEPVTPTEDELREVRELIGELQTLLSELDVSVADKITRLDAIDRRLVDLETSLGENNSSQMVQQTQQASRLAEQLRTTAAEKMAMEEPAVTVEMSVVGKPTYKVITDAMEPGGMAEASLPTDSAVMTDAEPSDSAVMTDAEPSDSALMTDAEPSDSALMTDAEPENLTDIQTPDQAVDEISKSSAEIAIDEASSDAAVSDEVAVDAEPSALRLLLRRALLVGPPVLLLGVVGPLVYRRWSKRRARQVSKSARPRYTAARAYQNAERFQSQARAEMFDELDESEFENSLINDDDGFNDSQTVVGSEHDSDAMGSGDLLHDLSDYEDDVGELRNTADATAEAGDLTVTMDWEDQAVDESSEIDLNLFGEEDDASMRMDITEAIHQESDVDHHYLDGSQGVDDDLVRAMELKLVLARAYIDNGFAVEARALLEEVIEYGNDHQREQAATMIQELGKGFSQHAS